MVETVRPVEQPPEDVIDLVEAYRIHSTVGFGALKRIVEGPLKERSRPDRREVLVRILDLLHKLSTDYRAFADELAEEFPDRVERWPALFLPRRDFPEEAR